MEQILEGLVRCGEECGFSPSADQGFKVRACWDMTCDPLSLADFSGGLAKGNWLGWCHLIEEQEA